MGPCVVWDGSRRVRSNDDLTEEERRKRAPGRPTTERSDLPGADYVCPWCARPHIRAGPHKGERVSQKMLHDIETTGFYKGTYCKQSPCRRGTLRRAAWRMNKV